MSKLKKLLIVDDDDELVELLSVYLFSQGFLVNGVNSVESALIDIRKHRPNLIIADIMMKKLDGYALIKLLKKNRTYLDIPVIFLTAKGLTEDRIRGYRLGCHAYITKPFNPEELLAIINNIFSHIYLIPKDSLYLLYITSLDKKKLESFTIREKMILELLFKGYMNKEIASCLNVSVRTIEKYITRLLKKTNTRNRTELVQTLVRYP